MSLAFFLQNNFGMVDYRLNPSFIEHIMTIFNWKNTKRTNQPTHSDHQFGFPKSLNPTKNIGL